MLWRHLRALPTRSHWRRQATIGPYFADFACHGARLVIEIDGGQHNFAKEAAVDTARTAYLEAQGYRVLRFWNNDVLGNIEGVLTIVMDAVVAVEADVPPTPDPSPPRASRAEGGEPKRLGSDDEGAGTVPA